MATAFGSGAALAQPLGGPHGPGGADAMIGHLIAHARAELKLNTMQQEMFDKAVANSKLAREKARALQAKVRDTLQAELAKPEPNLAAVAAAADAAMDEGRAGAEGGPRRMAGALRHNSAPSRRRSCATCCRRESAQGESFRQRMRERMHHFRDGVSG